MNNHLNENDIFISIMICCYNSEKYLSETIDSVINQTYTNWEIVAVNDGSSDNTEEIIQTYINKGVKIIYHYQENQGYASARNKAIEIAKGEWIAIIDHDDICLPDRLEKQAAQIKNNPNSNLFFSNVTYFNNEPKDLGYHFDYFDPSDLDLSAVSVLNHLLSHKCFIPSSSVVFNINSALSIGGFDTSYNYIPDFVFFLKMGELYNFSISKESLSKWRIHPNQATEITKDIHMKELRRIYIHYLTSDLVTQRVRAIALLRYIKFCLNSFFMIILKNISDKKYSQ